MSAKSWFTALGLLILAGCTFPVRQQVDSLICDRAHADLDESAVKEAAPTLADVKPKPAETAPGKEQPKTDLEKRLLQYTQPGMFPGSDAKDIFLPKTTDKADYKERIEPLIKEYYPSPSKLPEDKDFPPGPEGRPLTLADLQKIAAANSPLLRQAASDIEAARGAAIQAGVYPNPTLGYTSAAESFTSGSIMGPSITQTIKTMGKLKLAQAAAVMDLRAAEYAYRRAETDLLWNVRGNYYTVLVAEESIRANRGLVHLTDEVYKVMIDLLRGGEGVSASYEPAQMAVFAETARTALLSARNQRLLAWRQLAASMGVPHMPPTAVAGNVHRAVPRIDFEKALAHVLTKHTDVATAEAGVEKARNLLRLAQVTPIPDVTIGASLLYDGTPPGPSRLIPGVTVSVPLPIFDRNQGNIRSAQAALVRAGEQPHAVQANLTASFADAHRRYEENRVLLEMYEKNILPKQVQSFRGAVKLHMGGPALVQFTDLISAEQNLITAIGAYLPILQAQWQAVADVSSWLQTDQVYKMVEEVDTFPPLNLEELLQMPCTHPCSPVLLPPTSDSLRPVADPFAADAARPALQPAPARFMAPVGIDVSAAGK